MNAAIRAVTRSALNRDIAVYGVREGWQGLIDDRMTRLNARDVGGIIQIGGTFLGTLLIVSVITVRFSDMVLDSRIGALDRSLGFLFGLGRGLIIVVVAFLFFAWLVPDRSQPDWIRSAKSRVVLQGTGDWLMSMLPDDPESTILKRLRKPKQEEEEPTPGQRSSLDAPGRRRPPIDPGSGG